MTESEETPFIPTTVSMIPAGMENHPDYFIPEYDAEIELKPNFFCRARNVKREKYCRARAGAGTDHLGQGRCRNHGGRTPIKTGRYSEVVRESLGEHLDRLELETEIEQLDVLPEARLLRGITLDSLERFQSWQKAVIAWNEAESEEARAEKRRPHHLNVPDLQDLGKLTKSVAEIVSMVHKQRSENAIKLADFYRLMAAMAEGVNFEIDKALLRYVNAGVLDQDVLDTLKTKIQTNWREIKSKA